MIKRTVFLILGFLFLFLGFLGVLLPGLPTTPFILLATASFVRSSPKLHQWLLEHKIFGVMIKNWQKHKGVTRKTKNIAFLLIFAGAIYSYLVIENIYILIVVFFIQLIPIIILTRLNVISSKE
ncbi:MAG: YbaN family protein [Campylobacterales bacterium]|nr:YbaN family protein [Campylobacterales bacterium]